MAKLKKVEEEEVSKQKEMIENFTFMNFTLSEFMDLFSNQFDQWVIEKCMHFKD